MTYEISNLSVLKYGRLLLATEPSGDDELFLFLFFIFIFIFYYFFNMFFMGFEF